MPRVRIFVAAVILILIAVTAWQMQPERRLRRSWHKLIAVVEARHAGALGDLLHGTYSDRWGYTQATLVTDARLAFHHFDSIQVRVEQQQFQIAGDRATITATLRVEVRGTDRAAAARVAADSLVSPFTFEWLRTDHFPWAWRLVSFDQPEFDLNRFRRGMPTGY